MSKAEERRVEWLSRQYAADLASAPPIWGESKRLDMYQKARKLAIARAAVVKAAMTTFRAGYIDNEFCLLHAACAALANAEKE